jgi:5-methylcytosine-specific restriction endonuclease McrA
MQTEKVIDHIVSWLKEYAEKANATVRNRRARLNNAEGTHTVEDIQWLLEKQKYKCVYCKKSLRKEYHVDHIQPISKGGSNDKLNLQILCPTCNVRKHTKDPIEFAQSIGLLL